jgi:hypothetical protein
MNKTNPLVELTLNSILDDIKRLYNFDDFKDFEKFCNSKGVTLLYTSTLTNVNDIVDNMKALLKSSPTENCINYSSKLLCCYMEYVYFRITRNMRNTIIGDSYYEYLKEPDIVAERQDIYDKYNEETQLCIDTYQQFLTMGMKTWSDDVLAQLLAVVFDNGSIVSNSEIFVLNIEVNTIVNLARWRGNLYGGMIPDPDFIFLLKKYIKDLIEYSKGEGPNELKWFEELKSRYKIKEAKRR